MKESSQIAYSYVTSHLKALGAPGDFFDQAMIHLHVPEGATPKDGPSAGITMATALLSLALKKPVNGNVAMTGELTLTGNVLPIGGVKEKIIGARRAGIKTIILPIDNQRDYEEMPDYLKENVTVHFATTFNDVAAVCFGK